MGLKTLTEVIKFIDDLESFKELVVECRKLHLESQGKVQHANFGGSNNASKIISLLLKQLVLSRKNEFTYPIDTLATVLKTDNRHVSDRMLRYFREYGIGDYASTGKKKYNIYKLVDSTGKELDVQIRPEAHYTFYFSKTFIEVLRKKCIGSDFLDYNALLKDIDESALLLEKINNTKTTSVHIHQYLTKSLSVDTYIEIEKDFLNETGTYSRLTNNIMTDDDGSITKLCVEDVSNNFKPKVKVDVNEEEIKEEVSDLLGDFFDKEKDGSRKLKQGKGTKRSNKNSGFKGGGRANKSK